VTAEDLVREFYHLLHEHCKFAMLWTPEGDEERYGEYTREGKHSHYVETGKSLIPPRHWLDRNIYFGVNGSNIKKGKYEANTAADIVSVRTLYREHDGKDFTEPDPGEVAAIFTRLRNDPARITVKSDTLKREALGIARSNIFVQDMAKYKAMALAHVESLAPRPTYLVDSGGGYQSYWILDHPFSTIDVDDRNFMAEIQERWVKMDPKADASVHDLRRILRWIWAIGDRYVIKNRKPKYAPHFPVVRFMWAEPARRFVLEDLIDLLPPPPAILETPREARLPAEFARTQYSDDSVIDTYNKERNIREELLRYGYIPVKGNPKSNRMSRPGDKDSRGVEVFDHMNVSRHWSSNDDLVNKRTRTPFSLRLELDYGGNKAWAVYEIARELGMAYDQQESRVPTDLTPEERVNLAYRYLKGGK
jgi:hypothetical protein